MRRRRRHVQHPRVLALAVFAMLMLGTRAIAMPPPPRKGRAMTSSQLRELLRRAGFPDESLDVAVAIAKAESGGDPNAQNIVTPLQAATWNREHPGQTPHAPERSFGLFQVNALVWTSFDEGRLRDPAYNAHAALVISRGGTYWHDWSSYTSGRYLAFMPGGAQYEA